MALTFADLRTELFARGLDFLNDGGAGLTRAKRMLNTSMHAIDDMERWPYLQAVATGSSPLTIADLSQVGQVVDTANDNPLRPHSREELLHWYGDLANTGTATAFYITGGNVINAFPVATTSLSVLYWKTSPDMSADSDVPLMPDRFRMAIVEYAVAEALRDEVPDQAQLAAQAGDLIVQRMRNWAGDLQPIATYVPLVGDDS
jgi:hypothetical protein